MKAIALVCPVCASRLRAAPGIPLGVCDACPAAFDFSSGVKRQLQILEHAGAGSDPRAQRFPFIRFSAAAGGMAGPVFVMAFAITRIGSPHDDGMRMTLKPPDGDSRPGRVDFLPEISVPTAAGIARFLALKRFDPDANRNLQPEGVSLGAPCLLTVPFEPRAGRFFNPITGLAMERDSLPRR